MTYDESERGLIIEKIAHTPAAKVVAVSLESPSATRLDLSAANPRVAETDYSDTSAIATLVSELISNSGAVVGVGGYGERRGWYARGSQFTAGDDVRSIHLGVDVWADAGTPVFAPYDGVVHSLRDNALLGDYGPTVILTHEIGGKSFHCLFGHLSRESLSGKFPGSRVKRGELLGEIGSSDVNGQWPPHLHLQIILDMLGYVGDYPGVAAVKDRETFLRLCPDPNLILRSSLL